MAYYSDVTFNGTDLTTLTDVKINSVSLDRIPDIELEQSNIARYEGTKIYNKEFRSKTVLVDGYITSDTRENYLTARGALLKAVTDANKTLQVIIGNKPLEYTATNSNAIFTDSTGGYASFSLEFTCADPFGYDRDNRTIVNGTAITTASQAVSLSETIGGDYKTPATFTLSIVSITGGTGAYIDLANEAGDNIRITRDWANDDVLVVDAKAKTCKVNGVAVDYTGYFWNLNVGDTSITYSDSLTTRANVLTATYKRRYL